MAYFYIFRNGTRVKWTFSQMCHQSVPLLLTQGLSVQIIVFLCLEISLSQIFPPADNGDELCEMITSETNHIHEAQQQRVLCMPASHRACFSKGMFLLKGFESTLSLTIDYFLWIHAVSALTMLRRVSPVCSRLQWLLTPPQP